jgi:hypothetical protein
MGLYAVIALILIWSGSGWIIHEVERIVDTPEDNLNIYNNRADQFIMLHGVSMILIGIYIVIKNIIYRDSIIY